MRLESDVEEYGARIRLETGGGQAWTDKVGLYGACIPTDFWHVTDRRVTHNRQVWEDYIQKYAERLEQAFRGGWGLLLEGDNGVGKTMFMSYLLAHAVFAGFSVYYTTVLDLDFNLKRGMSVPEIMERMEEMLGSDFLGLDELSKEQFKGGDSWIRTQVERVLKHRHDNNLPTIVATNADLERIEESYGATVRSVLSGKYQRVLFDDGDFREELRGRMKDEMGYE